MRSSLPSKKRKLGETDPTTQTIQDLENQLAAAVSEGRSLNPLADLLAVALDCDATHRSKAIYSLYRVFVTIISRDLLSSPDSTAEAKAVRTWLSDKFHAFAELLTCVLQSGELNLKTSALDILLSLQKHLSSSLTRVADSKHRPQFHHAHFRRIVNALLLWPSPSQSLASKKRRTEISSSDQRTLDPDVRDHFFNTWFSVYDDIRWFFLRDAALLISKHPHNEVPQLAGNLLSILERLTTFPTKAAELNAWWVEDLGSNPPVSKKPSGEWDEDDDLLENSAGVGDEEDDWRKYFEEPIVQASGSTKAPTTRLHTLTLHQSLHSLTAHRAIFTKAWLALLPRLSYGSMESTKAFSLRVLHVLHRGVVPHLTRPILIMDWVSSAVDHGSTIGLLALNALFMLMKDYNLDYPSFYTRLYSFLERDMLHLKHRARFFRLTELFLSSTHLPANLVASFVKRLSRLSLTAPPAAIVMLIPFTYNMLRRHPALMAMIHRTDDNAGVECDGFLVAEPNPALTNALESSLWELYSHRQHYHASISTLAKIFEEAFTRPSYAMEDFLDHAYSTSLMLVPQLFDTAIKRKIRKAPAIASALEFSQAPEDDGMGELWSRTIG